MTTRQDAKARLRPFGIQFEKSLHDLIRGIRGCRTPEARDKYLRTVVSECRSEVKSQDMEVKSTAILKLTYLEMYGIDMSWASFHVLEVMSSNKFQQKRIGYLAAMQSFRKDTDVLMLTTNLLKKDLGSSNSLEVGVAIGGLSNIVTPGLAQDISDDVSKMMNHSKPFIRKKAVLVMYKIFLQFPEALRTSYPRLRDKLEDPDISVVSATVNVICELAKKNPRNFLPLAPQLYGLLTTSTNNWMLIKIIKLFASLAPIEPRLKGKLLPPIMSIVQSTSAMSLLYECINCLLTGNLVGTEDNDLASLCADRLGAFLSESDPNLIYVGLLAFNKMAKVHPIFVLNHQAAILECLDNPDLTIRQRALEITCLIVTPESLFDVVKRLLLQLVSASTTRSSQDQEDPKKQSPESLPAQYRGEVISRIIDMCSRDTFDNISNFDWYVAVLIDLVQVSDKLPQAGEQIGAQLRDVAVRVPDARPVTITACARIITNDGLYELLPSLMEGPIFVIGEYANYVEDIEDVISHLCKAPCVRELRPYTLALYVQAIMKLYAHVCRKQRVGWGKVKKAYIKQLTEWIIAFLENMSTVIDIEVQERAVEYLELMRLAQEAIDSQPQDDEDEDVEIPLLLVKAIPTLFEGFQLLPVAPSAQNRVQPPEGLDLSKAINPNFDVELMESDNFSENDDDDDDDEDVELQSSASQGEDNKSGPTAYSIELSPEEISRRIMERRERQRDDPFYINADSPSRSLSSYSRISPDTAELASSMSPNINVEGDQMGISLSEEQRQQASQSPPVLQRVDSGLSASYNSGGGLSSGTTWASSARGKSQIIKDETLDVDDNNNNNRGTQDGGKGTRRKKKKQLLSIDANGLGEFNIIEGEDETAIPSTTEESAGAVEEQAAPVKKVVRKVKKTTSGEVSPSKKKKSKKKVADEPGVSTTATPVIGHNVKPKLVKKKKKKPTVAKIED